MTFPFTPHQMMPSGVMPNTHNSLLPTAIAPLDERLDRVNPMREDDKGPMVTKLETPYSAKDGEKRPLENAKPGSMTRSQSKLLQAADAERPMEEQAEHGEEEAKGGEREADCDGGYKRNERKRRSSSLGSHSDGPACKHHEKSYVHHDYHDHSQDVTIPETVVVLPASSSLCKKGRGGVSSMFPTVLHAMLEDAEKKGFVHIVGWQPHGRAFHVHDTDKFVSEIMPMYFRHTRFSSFQRQLSLYGFTRLTRKGKDRGAYYHELFLRGDEFAPLCINMVRTRVKGTVVRQSSCPEEEPHFEDMPPVGQSHEPEDALPQRTFRNPEESDAPAADELTRGKTFYPVTDEIYQELHPWGLKYMHHILPKGLFYQRKYNGSGDSDLVDFLAEVDLDSDDDGDNYESEEAMARILEQEVTQMSAV